MLVVTQTSCTAPEPADVLVAMAIDAAAGRHGVPYALLLALAYERSQYRPQLAEHDRFGLFALPRAYCSSLEVPTCPVRNADTAAKLIRAWHDSCAQSWAHAVACLQWSPQAVAASMAPASWPRAVSAHVRRVLLLGGYEVPFEIPVFVVRR